MSIALNIWLAGLNISLLIMPMQHCLKKYRCRPYRIIIIDLLEYSCELIVLLSPCIEIPKGMTHINRRIFLNVRWGNSDCFTKGSESLGSMVNDLLCVSRIFTVHELLQLYSCSDRIGNLAFISPVGHVPSDIHRICHTVSYRLLKHGRPWHHIGDVGGKNWGNYDPRRNRLKPNLDHMTDSSESQHSISMRYIININIHL
jgi:hypothetical protein